MNHLQRELEALSTMTTNETGGGAVVEEPPIHEWEARGRQHDKAFQTIRDHIDTNQSITEVVHAINYLKRELSDLFSAYIVCDQTYNDIWDIVRPDPETWDYPPQITRYVRYQSEQLAAARERLAVVEGALKFYANKDLYLAVVTTYKTGEYDLDCPLLYEGGETARKALAQDAAEGAG